MGFLLGLLPYLAAGLALFGAYEAAQHWCNTACHKQTELAQEATQALADYRTKAAAEIAAIASLWDQKRQEAEANAHEAEQARERTFAALDERAKAVARANRIQLDADTQRLLADARSAAVAATAGPASEPKQADPAPAGSTQEYIVQLEKWGASGWAMVREIREWYRGLQSGSGTAKP